MGKTGQFFKKIIKHKKTEQNDDLEAKHIRTANKIIALIVISFIVIAGLSYLGLFNETYHYRLTTTLHPINVTLSNGDYETVNLRSIVSLHTTTLSAKNPIHVEMRLEPEPNDTKNKNYDWSQLQTQKHHYAIFDGSIFYEPLKRENNEYMTGVIQLEYHDNPPHYYGDGNIEYQFEGGNGYFYITDKEAEENAQDNYVVLENIKFENRTNKKTIFPVGSSEQTITLKNNNLILGVTWIFIAFGIIQTKDWVRTAIITTIKRWHNWRLSKMSR